MEQFPEALHVQQLMAGALAALGRLPEVYCKLLKLGADVGFPSFCPIHQLIIC